jgi:hypothetical protein
MNGKKRSLHTTIRCETRNMRLLFDPFPFSLGVWTAGGVPGTLDYPTLSNASSWTTGEYSFEVVQKLRTIRTTILVQEKKKSA